MGGLGNSFTLAGRTRLSMDEKDLIEARRNSITRMEAIDYLGWSNKKVERVWKAITRKELRMKKII